MESDNRFDDYIKRYSECHHISPEEALTHAMVREVRKYYDEEQKGGLICVR